MLSWIELVGGHHGGGYVPVYAHDKTDDYHVLYEVTGVPPVRQCRQDMATDLSVNGERHGLRGKVFIVRIDSDGVIFPVLGLHFWDGRPGTRIKPLSANGLAMDFDRNKASVAVNREIPIEVYTHYVDQKTRERMAGAVQ